MAYHSDLEMAEILLGYGVDFNLQNNFGKVRREGREKEKGKEERNGRNFTWLWC